MTSWKHMASHITNPIAVTRFLGNKLWNIDKNFFVSPFLKHQRERREKKQLQSFLRYTQTRKEQKKLQVSQIIVWWHVNNLARLTVKQSNNSQKQPSTGVLRKRCSENMQQIYRRAPMPKSGFNKVAKRLYWNHTSA